MKKRLLSLFLVFTFILTAFPSWAFANEEEATVKETELKIETVRRDGKSYIEIPVGPVKEKAKDGVHFRSIDLNTPDKDGAGQKINAAATIVWQMHDWKFPAEGFKAKLQIGNDANPRNNETIAEVQVTGTVPVPEKVSQNHFQFITTDKYKKGDENGDLKLVFDNSFRANCRIAAGYDSDAVPNGKCYYIVVTQITMPAYTAEWYDNGDKNTRPFIKGMLYSAGLEEGPVDVKKENLKYGTIGPESPRYVDENDINGNTIGMVDFIPTGNITEPQLKMSVGQTPIATGKFVSYVTKAIDPSDFSATETEHKLDNTSGKIESHAITSMGGNPGKVSPAYFYQLIGDNNHMWRFQMREVLKVKLNSGAGKVNEEKDKDLHVGNKKFQEIGHSEKIYNNDVELTDYIRKTYPKKDGETDEQLKKRVSEATQSQRVIEFDTDETITPPKAKVKGTEVDTVFKGWATEAQTINENKELSPIKGLLVNADKTLTDEGNAYKFTKDTTLYAVFAPKGVGKVNFDYVDDKGNKIISTEQDAKDYRYLTAEEKKKITDEKTEAMLLDEKYPSDKTGTEGDTIDASLASTAEAPSFLGYKVIGVEVTPAAEEGKTQTFTEDGKYTITYKYEKLDPVIPEKDGDKTNEKPDGYVTVTFHADKEENTGDKQRGKVYTTDDTKLVDKIVYFVNPADGIMLSNDKLVAKVKPNKGYKNAEGLQFQDKAESLDNLDVIITDDSDLYAQYVEKDKVVKLDDPENPTNFPKDSTDNSKNDADYVTVKFVADKNGKIKEGEAEKAKGIAYAVLKNTEWADAVKAGVVVPEENATENNPKLVGKDKFHSFKEWQKDGAKVTEFAKVGDTNVTYTAVFGKADELSVTYNLNAPEGLTVGGDAPTDDTKYLKDEEVTVKALAADNKLAGYEFTGWNTQADGKGTAYAADAKFAIKADTKLFAQWKKTAPDVIPVDNDTDQKGKNDEEIPTNYVFVEFKVKDKDADKANIKADQQAKFKVDPKATVTLTAPELEVKEAYKVSHTAKFNESDYTNKVFAKATTIWASVSEKGKIEVKYVFETNPKNKDLPEALAALKPTDLKDGTAVYPENAPATPKAPDTSSEKAQKALIERDAKDKKLGEWKAGNWEKDVDKNTGNITYTLTWTFEEVGKSKQPDVNPVKPGDKKITGKGEPGSDIEVKIPDKDDPIKTTVDKNGDWTVDVPEDKKLKDGDKVIVTQTEKDKKTSDPVEKTVKEDKKPEPKPEPVPEVEIPGIKYKDHKVPTYPVYAVVEKKDTEKVIPPEIFTHEQYIFGYPDDTIRPDGDMTRAEAIAVVARLQKLDLSDKTSNIYKDTKAGMWYNAAINAAFREGYLLEKEGENIRPNDKITRAELALLISHIDKKNDTVAPFEDVKGHKFEAAINQAYGNERIKGYPDGTFKPDNSITRAEVATMLNKLYDRYPDKNFIDANQNLVHNYKDMSYKGHWGYYELVEAYHTHKFARLANNMEEWKAIIK